MKITEAPTKLFRSFNGLEARTITTRSGQTFEICTIKRYSGNLVTTANKNDVEDSGACIVSHVGETFLYVNHGKVRCTEKTVIAAHFEALELFEAKIKETPLVEIKNEVPEVGDILFLDGYSCYKGSTGNKWIIYNICKNGRSYDCIEMDTLELRVKDYVRPFSKKLGIGVYFEKGHNMSAFGIDSEKLAQMLIDAKEVKKVADEKKRIENEAAKKASEENAEYLAQFIQADRRKTTSIIKSHCLKTWPISKIDVSTEVYSDGSSMDVTYYAPQKIEALESFIDNFQYGHVDGMQDMYEYSNSQDIIVAGHILQQYKYVRVEFEESEEPIKNEFKKPEGELIDWDTIFDEPAPEKTEAFEIVKTKHTLKGFDLWVVKLVDRVSKDAFNDLLNTAKKFGGWYSAFNKNGAIAGFQFKSEESANEFTVNII